MIETENENWMHKRKQRIEQLEDTLQGEFDYAYKQHNILHALKHCIDLNTDIIRKLIREYANSPLYFQFGKYKGRIVQDILEEDIQYCNWFKTNVIGKDFYTLLIIDYIMKNGNRNVESNFDQIRLKILSKYIRTQPENYIVQIEEYTRRIADRLYSSTANPPEDKYLCEDTDILGYEDMIGISAYYEAGEIF